MLFRQGMGLVDSWHYYMLYFVSLQPPHQGSVRGGKRFPGSIVLESSGILRMAAVTELAQALSGFGPFLDLLT